MDSFEQFLTKHRKPILIIITLIIVGFIGYNAAILISRIGKVKVLVMYAPFDATVTINDKEYKNNETHYLAPGDYNVTASREHFETINDTYTVAKDSTDNFFIGGLLPSDEEGEAIMLEHNNEYIQMEQYGSAIANAEGEEAVSKDPIMQFLPINNPAYSISYFYDDNQNFFVELILKQGIDQISSALGTLYSINDDINPASYKIVVRDYKNPFGSFKENNQNNMEDFLKEGYGQNFINNYTILSNRTISQDNYYGVLIIPAGVDITSDDATYPIYRAILEKTGDSWKMISEPYFVVSQYNASSVPVDFLNLLNTTFALEDI